MHINHHAKADKQIVKFIPATKELKEDQKEYLKELKEIMHSISHRIRQPVASILGLIGLLDHQENSAEEIKKILLYLKASAASLDKFTKELSLLVYLKIERIKKKSMK